MHQEGGRRKNGVFRAITQLTRERCSLCPVNCFDSDTRKPILSTTSTQRSGARHFFEAVDRDNRRSAGILHSSGNGHLEIETSVISLSRVRDVPTGSLAAQEKEMTHAENFNGGDA